MKLCSKCGDTKELAEFHRNKAKPDGHHSYCKPCARSYYTSWADRTEGAKTRHADWKEAKQRENRARLREFMAGKSCIDCGFSDVRALEFDHVRGTKHKGVLTMVSLGYRWEVILEEIGKCEIRCRNCHWIATAVRGDWWTSK